MQKIRLILGVVLGLFILGFNVPAFAQTTPDVSDSKKSGEVQPSGGNPQNDVGTGLQNTNSSLQPLPGQTNLSQPVLSGKADLQVEGSTAEPNRNTTTAGSEPVRYPRNNLPFVVIGLLTLAGILYYTLQPSNAVVASSTAQEKVKPEVVNVKPVKANKKKQTPPVRRAGKKKHASKKRKK